MSLYTSYATLVQLPSIWTYRPNFLRSQWTSLYFQMLFYPTLSFPSPMHFDFGHLSMVASTFFCQYIPSTPLGYPTLGLEPNEYEIGIPTNPDHPLYMISLSNPPTRFPFSGFAHRFTIMSGTPKVVITRRDTNRVN